MLNLKICIFPCIALLCGGQIGPVFFFFAFINDNLPIWLTDGVSLNHIPRLIAFGHFVEKRSLPVDKAS